MDRSWKRSGAPQGAITILGRPVKGSRGGVRGGVNPSLGEVENYYIYDFAKLAKRMPSKPPIAQRAGGIIIFVILQSLLGRLVGSRARVNAYFNFRRPFVARSS